MIRRFLTVAAMLVSICIGTVYAAGKKISGYLDPTGIEYSVISAGAWKQVSLELDAALNNMLWQEISREEDRFFILQELSLVKMLRDMSGVEYAEGCGFSSTELSDGYINHRVFLALEPGKPGLLNELPGRNRIRSAEFFRKLPEKVVFAAAMDVNAAFLPEIFRQSGGAGEEFFRQWRTLIDVFSKASGIWEIAAVSKDAEKKELYWRVSAPDDKGELMILASRLGKKDGSQKSTVTVTTPFGVFISKNGRITFFSSKEAVKAFVPAMQKVRVQKLPESAAAVCYFDPIALKLNYPAKIGGVSIRTALAEKPVAAALVRTPDGLLTVFNSDRTFLSIGMNHILQYFAWLNTVKLPSEIMPEAKKKGYYGKAVKTFNGDPAGEKELNCSCETDLKYVCEVLKKSGFPVGCYRISKDMKVEKVPNRDCEMVCFGSIISGKPVPVVVSKGHGDGFCALLSSGEVKRFTLKKADSWRRITGFLHTVYMYEERVFRMLTDQAGAWDKE
ncbi:MAG: hypothetical protein E7057_01760 [Lentisphaerae bacterium]|nr:hypothetical protein [Lentisphaerota bacterium]